MYVYIYICISINIYISYKFIEPTKAESSRYESFRLRRLFTLLLAVWPNGWLTGWLAARLGQLAGWRGTRWLDGWLADWLAGDWLGFWPAGEPPRACAEYAACAWMLAVYSTCAVVASCICAVCPHVRLAGRGFVSAFEHADIGRTTPAQVGPRLK